jgi:hypothetical protein
MDWFISVEYTTTTRRRDSLLPDDSATVPKMSFK